MRRKDDACLLCDVHTVFAIAFEFVLERAAAKDEVALLSHLVGDFTTLATVEDNDAAGSDELAERTDGGDDLDEAFTDEAVGALLVALIFGRVVDGDLVPFVLQAPPGEEGSPLARVKTESHTGYGFGMYCPMFMLPTSPCR